MKYKVIVYYDNMEDSEHASMSSRRKMKQSTNCTDWD